MSYGEEIFDSVWLGRLGSQILMYTIHAPNPPEESPWFDSGKNGQALRPSQQASA